MDEEVLNKLEFVVNLRYITLNLGFRDQFVSGYLSCFLNDCATLCWHYAVSSVLLVIMDSFNHRI